MRSRQSRELERSGARPKCMMKVVYLHCLFLRSVWPQTSILHSLHTSTCRKGTSQHRKIYMFGTQRVTSGAVPQGMEGIAVLVCVDSSWLCNQDVSPWTGRYWTVFVQTRQQAPRCLQKGAPLINQESNSTRALSCDKSAKAIQLLHCI